MAEQVIFDRFSVTSAGDLNERSELRGQLFLADRLQQKLKTIQKFKVFDPLTTKENPVHLDGTKLDDLLKRKMMQ